MKEWIMWHPYLTTLIFLLTLLSIESILREWARAFGARKGAKEDETNR